jgi:hypothetical protein
VAKPKIKSTLRMKYHFRLLEWTLKTMTNNKYKDDTKGNSEKKNLTGSTWRGAVRGHVLTNNFLSLK